MLQGVFEFFTEMVTELKMIPSPPHEKDGEDDEIVTTEMSPLARQPIDAYITQFWDYVTRFYSGKEPTHYRHLYAGLSQNGDLWFVPERHILIRYLNSDASFYKPVALIDTEFGNFNVYSNSYIEECMKVIAMKCVELGKVLELEQEEIITTI
jgi:hypothetical protein